MTLSRLEKSQRSCRRLARRTARNFYVSFYGLSADRFTAMCSLYAFLRLSDDLGDRPGWELQERRERLLEWRGQLEMALRATSPPRVEPVDVFPALADTIQRYGVPAESLFAVLDGIGMDLEASVYETFSDLKRYCDRVAGAVGVCCIHVWGFHDEAAIERAIDCGTAFQLTNILRDLAEDIQMQRVYLPREDLRRFGYTVEDLRGHRINEAFVELMRFQVERARTFYESAEVLFDDLEPRGRPILRAMMRVYMGLLNQIEHRGYDVFSSRVRLPAWRKLLIAVRAIAGRRR